MLICDFVNVGKWNCTVIKFPSGRLSVIDIDNSLIDDKEDILQDPIEFIQNEYPQDDIFRFILTHPDMDHMSGLHELNKIKSFQNFWDTNHDKVLDPDKDDFGPYNVNDWLSYQKLRKSENSPKTLRLYRDSTSDCCWEADNIRILSPSKNLDNLSHIADENDSDKYNHISYVLRVEYNGAVILLGGDATKAAWREIYQHYHGRGEETILKADIFLAPHHGSPSNIEEEVFKFIDPDYVIISDHRGHKYDYKFYNSIAKKQVYSTKHNGNIKVILEPVGNTILPQKG